MIKLVASDIDNTLIPDGTPTIPEAIFEMIIALRRRGILFAVSTGRQFQASQKLFTPVKDDLIFISENGARVQCPGDEPGVVFMDPIDVEELVREYRKFRPQGEFVVSTDCCVYIENPSPYFLHLIENGMRYDYKIVEDVLREQCKVFKVSLHMKDGVCKIARDFLIPKWKDRVNIMIGSDTWLPSIAKNVDKGTAIQKIQRLYGILPEETMVFGDGGNDIGMFHVASESYAVENAAPELRVIAKHECPTCEKLGVYHTIMREILKTH